MSAGEFAFLALGLVLGVASGAGIVVVLRSRPPAAREIRLTITPDSVPRSRPATLATEAFAMAPAEPARGGPADRRSMDRPEPTIGTPVPEPARAEASDPSMESGADGGPGAAPLTDADRSPEPILSPPRYGTVRPIRSQPIAIPIHNEPDAAIAWLRATAVVAAGRTARASVATPEAPAAPQSPFDEPHAAVPVEPSPVPAPVGLPSDAIDDRARSDAGGSARGASRRSDACLDLHHQADERCAVAGRARDGATAARDALRAAQRDYDDHRARADEAEAAADPRAIQAAKESARAAFRESRATGVGEEAIEAAARDWLREINRINADSRTAATRAVTERDAAAAMITTIERLTIEADAGRIAAETAESACTGAREAVAACEEAAVAAARTPGPVPVMASGVEPAPKPSPARATAGAGASGDEAPLLASGGDLAILRLVRGDRATLARIVGELGGDDPVDRRRWQLALSELVDAILGRAIEASALELPADHPFWSTLTPGQRRDVVAALASVGYRFDGLGGWVDGRVPSQRDLSLAVGYAGMDPMRIRQWPTEAEAALLLKEATVAADEYLIGAAGDLTLGELVTLLGRRADGLTDLWNDWGRLRPLLVSRA